MEIDEHLKYTLYVSHDGPSVSKHDPLTHLQPTIRPVPTRWRTHGITSYPRLLLVDRYLHLVCRLTFGWRDRLYTYTITQPRIIEADNATLGFCLHYPSMSS